jgi:hypothetical protein
MFCDINLDVLPLENYFFMASDNFNLIFGMVHILVLITINSRIKDVYQLIDQKKFNFYKQKEIMKIYSHLQDILKATNNYFSFNSMTLFGGYIFFFVSIIFALYDFCVRNFPFENFMFFFGGLLQQFETATIIFYVLIHSDILRCSGRKISEKIDSKISSQESVKIKKISQIFNLQNSYEICVSSGLFEFNTKMIFSLISTGFAYIVVAIQFDMMLQ